MKHFGARVNRLRTGRGWTTRQLAARTGLSNGTISRAENGYEIVLSAAVGIARALGVSLADLTADPVCGTCDGFPPEGFTCNECQRGSEVTQ